MQQFDLVPATAKLDTIALNQEFSTPSLSKAIPSKPTAVRLESSPLPIRNGVLNLDTDASGEDGVTVLEESGGQIL